MAYDNKDNRLRRKDAVGMEQLVQDYIREMKIASGINRQRAMEAWNKVSGAARYTLDIFLDKGVMYVTLNSSMARNQLYFQRELTLSTAMCWGSLIAQLIENLPAMQETRVPFLGWEDPLETEMETHSSFLA